jgi:acetylornithine deacetylase/succinyl-diaminopimelate desuccinylase-like protein
VPYETGNRERTRIEKTAALIVRWRGPVRSKLRPIMVMGHMDVVDARPSDFTSDPFTLAERDGYFYGRGTVYMKGGIVAVVRAMIEFRARGFKPTRDISLLFTGDKESHGRGAEKAVGEWLGLLGHPEYGLNADGLGILKSEDGKPIGASMPTAEKAYADYTFTVRNPGGHSGKPRPDNAIYSLARALERLSQHRFTPVMNETTRAYFTVRQTTAPPPLAAAIGRWLANPEDGAAADEIEATDSEVGLTRTRCVATMINGGHATNALPELATALVNCRLFPGASPDALRDELETMVGDPKVVVTRNDRYPATVTSPLRTDVTAAFTKAVQTIHPGMPVAPTIVNGATDARTFRAIGIPVYAVSAQWLRAPGDLRVNQRDERIPVQSLYDGVRHWKIMLRELAGR